MSKIKINFMEILLAILLIYCYFRSVVLALAGSLSTIIAFICIILLLIGNVLNFRGKIYKKNFFSIVMWLLFICLILLHCYNFKISMTSLTTLTTVGGVLVGISYIFKKNKWSLTLINISKKCLRIHIIATLLFAFIPSLYFSTVINIYDVETQNILRTQMAARNIPGLTNHYSANGIYMAIACLLFGTEFFVGNDKNKKESRIWFISTIIALLVTGKRAHLLFSIFALMIIYFKCSNVNINKKLRNFLIAVVGGATLFTIIMYFVPALNSTFLRILQLFDTDDVTNGRLLFYDYAIKWFKQNPIIGIGWEGFKYKFYQDHGAYLNEYQFMNVHNVYLQICCELGIVGEVIFVTRMIYDIVNQFKMAKWNQLKNSDLKQVLAFAFSMNILFCLYCFTGNPLYDAEFFIPYMLIIGAGYNIIEVYKL